MRTRSKHFYASIYFLNELISNKSINAIKLAKEESKGADKQFKEKLKQIEQEAKKREKEEKKT